MPVAACPKCGQTIPVTDGRLNFHRDHADRACIGTGMTTGKG